jgi:hypothetical protein
MTNKFGNAEMHYIPMEEIHTPHSWRCCWKRTIGGLFYTLVIGAGIVLIMSLAFLIDDQINAHLSI